MAMMGGAGVLGGGFNKSKYFFIKNILEAKNKKWVSGQKQDEEVSNPEINATTQQL